jgi:hypothetical protein
MSSGSSADFAITGASSALQDAIDALAQTSSDSASVLAYILNNNPLAVYELNNAATTGGFQAFQVKDLNGAAVQYDQSSASVFFDPTAMANAAASLQPNSASLLPVVYQLNDQAYLAMSGGQSSDAAPLWGFDGVSEFEYQATGSALSVSQLLALPFGANSLFENPSDATQLATGYVTTAALPDGFTLPGSILLALDGDGLSANIQTEQFLPESGTSQAPTGSPAGSGNVPESGSNGSTIQASTSGTSQAPTGSPAGSGNVPESGSNGSTIQASNQIQAGSSAAGTSSASGGQLDETPSNQPITVEIFIFNTDGTIFSTGSGILIDQSHVLTAQHVLHYDDGTVASNANIVVVPDFGGTLDAATIRAEGFQLARSPDFWRGEYDGKNDGSIPPSEDIALLTLSGSVSLPESAFDGLASVYDGADLAKLGWGREVIHQQVHKTKIPELNILGLSNFLQMAT